MTVEDLIIELQQLPLHLEVVREAGADPQANLVVNTVEVVKRINIWGPKGPRQERVVRLSTSELL